MLREFCCLVLILGVSKSVCGDEPGYYTIKAPKTLRPNSEYNMAVTIHKSPEPIPIKISINGDLYSKSKELLFQPRTSQVVKFNIPDLQSGSYNLTVESNSILDINRVETLLLDSKQELVLIQTDKSFYKPGDLVRYRIVALDHDLKPVGNDRNITISITDGKGNLIQKRSEVRLTKGVYSDQLQLSAQPVFGQWKISVIWTGQNYVSQPEPWNRFMEPPRDSSAATKEFSVEEYELPTFEVKIDTQENVFYGDKKIFATIRAKYTFEKPVKGQATVVLYPEGQESPLTEQEVKKTDRISDFAPRYSSGPLAYPSGTPTYPYGIPTYPYGIPTYPSGRPGNPSGAIYPSGPLAYPSGTPAYPSGTPTYPSGRPGNSSGVIYPSDPPTYPFVGSGNPSGYLHRARRHQQGMRHPPGMNGPSARWITDDPSWEAPHHIKRVVAIDGKGKVEFDLEGFPLNFMRDLTSDDYVPDDKKLILQAVVEDELTGKKYNTSTTIKVHSVQYYLKLNKAPKFFKPNEPFVVSAKLEDLSGKPVGNSEHPVKFLLTKMINFNNPRDEPLCMTDEKYFNSNGVADITYTLPEMNNTLTQYQINARYLNSAIKLRTLTSFKTSSYTLSVEVKTENIFVGKEVELEIQSPVAMEYFVYQISAKGNILENRYVEVRNTDFFTLKFIATRAMVPKADVLIYFIDNLDLLTVETTIELAKEPLNFIKLHVPRQSEPGEDVDITVRTNPNSYVAIMGVDQSVLLYKESTSLTNEEVFDEINKVKNGGVMTLTNIMNHMHGTYRSPSGYGVSGMPGSAYAAGPGMPMAVSGSGQQIGQSTFMSAPNTIEPPRVRKEFPETWIWESIENTDNQGRAILHKKVPDSITSWVVTGFSIDPITGFAASKNPRSIRVIQPFFVTTTLPYSIKRGESLSIPVSVYNYLEQDLETDIILDDSENEFEFVASNSSNPSHKRITIPANSGKSVTFIIKATKVGPIHIKATATSQLAGDAVENVLLVKPEGFTEYATKSYMIDLRNEIEQTNEVVIELPENLVTDSVYIEATATADLLGAVVTNLQHLVRKPTGCGEQIMVNFVPNIYVYSYLEKTNQLTDELKKKIIEYLELGYQRELSYKHDDGSFSAFGKSDRVGSTWLTAYVARSFRQASKYIEVNSEIVNEAVQFLISQQNQDGSFAELGNIIDSTHVTNRGVPLTVFVTLALIENAATYTDKSQVMQSVGRALDYIAEKATSSHDVYSIAMAAYAMQKVVHPSRGYFIDMLQRQATIKDDKKWWSTTGSSHSSFGSNKNIEVTAYAALAFLEAGMDAESLTIFKFLVGSQNRFGGFESTQDTVVGLQALSIFSEKFPTLDTNINFVFTVEGGHDVNLHVKEDTALVLHSAELPSSARRIRVTATGHGIALGQIAYKYNVDKFEQGSKFWLHPTVTELNNKSNVKITACTSYVGELGSSLQSNMAIMEVSLPSGYVIDKENLNSLKGSYNIKRVETKDGETVAVVYFDYLNEIQVCPIFEAFRTHKVAEEKPASVVVYDYYDNSRQTKLFYSVTSSSICDICEGECGNSCPVF